MAFDQTTRNRLARFVSEARNLLTEEFTRQLQHEYGLDPASGTVTPLEKLTALDDTRWETASILRETMAYYLEGKTGTAQEREAVLVRILREQAFTVLNRICALRLAEARGLILQAVGGGYQSQGFQLYARLAGPALGETGEAYRSYLFSLFDEMAVELPPLFDRFSPEGRLFPRQTALLSLLDLLNDPELETLWNEDETIGWIYQYFNTQEERKAMRKVSQAPRNSRELAVRNQFFTPRYVVEFLTDNTLGRIWYEMVRGETAMVDTCAYLVRRPTEIFLDEGVEAPEQESSDDELSQEELLRQPVYIPYRRLKDPREIKMLDPACGSMHFGLYAFDLFEQIYAEAWELEENLGAEALWRLADLDPLHKTYPDKAAFLRDVPRLIIEHNIHGIDIDPRAVQIAGLSLWLRAHKSWGNSSVRQADRPQIRKSNIVCAEPMPGDRRMLDDFLATLDEARLEALLRETVFLPAGRSLRVTKAMADALVDLVRTVWEEMELAGEAGSLLKVEETLWESISEARKVSAEKSPLFRVLEFDLGGNAPQTDLDFWDYAERLVLAALQDYAEQSANGVGYRRRLFAGDAAQGFAFIDLCRKRYDAVLMNPPFGKATGNVESYIKKIYPKTKNNLYCTFVEASYKYCIEGFVGLISARTFVMYRDFEKFRQEILLESNTAIKGFADLGWEVLDEAQVETAAYVLERSKFDITKTGNLIGPFCRLLAISPQNKGETLLELCNNLINETNVFYVKPDQFSSLPGSPLAYWASQRLIKLFSKSDTFEPSIAYCGRGAAPHVFFFRLAWEIPLQLSTNDNWSRLAHGGYYSPFFRENSVFIDWEDGGKKVKQYIVQKYPYLNGNYGWAIQDEDKYGQVGLTSGKRNERFNAQLMPAGHIFTNEGQGYIPYEIEDIWFALGYLNSSLVSYYLSLTSGLQKTWVYIRPIPVIEIDNKTRHIVEKVAKENFEIKRKWSTGAEESALFISPWFLGESLHVTLKQYLTQIANKHSTDSEELNNNWQELSHSIIKASGINKSDIVEVETDYQRHPNDLAFPAWRNISKPNIMIDALSYTFSYLFGCVFGRWDIRYATREIPLPEIPDHFAPLPVCPPGMLQNTHGLPAAPDDVPAIYPLHISWKGILVDDTGHPEDIIGRAREAQQVIWNERAEAIEAEACEILGVGSLREYFQRTNLFFDDHLKRYSKNRRYAPIYWPLSTSSGSYTLWLYYHRVDDQILYTCVNDFVDPKLKQVGEDLVRLRGKSGRSRDEELELERLIDLERELKDFRAELLRVAAFWEPNLNDGVQITAAPLWRLFQHRKWQKRLKSTWEKLEAGEYDWAHLAYSIWPERVREKCKTDKSLAIAHDLEHLYVEPVKKKKKSRRKKKSSASQSEMFNED